MATPPPPLPPRLPRLTCLSLPSRPGTAPSHCSRCCCQCCCCSAALGLDLLTPPPPQSGAAFRGSPSLLQRRAATSPTTATPPISSIFTSPTRPSSSPAITFRRPWSPSTTEQSQKDTRKSSFDSTFTNATTPSLPSSSYIATPRGQKHTPEGKTRQSEQELESEAIWKDFWG